MKTYHYYVVKQLEYRDVNIDGLINLDDDWLVKPDSYINAKKLIIDRSKECMEEQFAGYDGWILKSLTRVD